MHQHLCDLGAMARVRERREAQLRRADDPPFETRHDHEHVPTHDVTFDALPPGRGVIRTERQQEPDRRAARHRVGEYHSKVGDGGIEGRAVEADDLEAHLVAGTKCSANAASASQSYGPLRTAMLSRSTPASRNSFTTSAAREGVPRRKPVKPRVSAPHSRW